MDDEIHLHTAGGGKAFHEQIDEVRNLLEENLRYTKTIHEFTPKDALDKEKEFIKLLRDNFEYTRACYAILGKINKWIMWQKIFSVLKIFLIVIPILFAILYLPPLLGNALNPYIELLQNSKKIP